MSSLILEPRVFHWLDGLRLRPKKKFSGSVHGERVTQAKGVSIEFSDYREYAEGDDLRHLDWNVFARLGQPVTKTYRDEEDLAVHILLDGSASMGFARPSKLSKAQELAAALGYVALNGGDTVYPKLLSGVPCRARSFRGRSAFPQLSSWVNSARAEGRKSLADEIRVFAGSSVRPGVVLFLSDGLSPTVSSVMRSIAARAHEIWMLQVLSDAELSPDLEGDVRLLDAEQSSVAEVTINSLTLREYKANLENHNAALAAECLRTGGRYALVTNSMSVEDVIKNIWKREGWLA